MKLTFTLHGLPDSNRSSEDQYSPGKIPVIRIKQYDKKKRNFEKHIGILWFTDATEISLNTDAGWRYYNLKKL